MPIRITGLTSGLDTESIISALVSSYNYKTNKYKKAQTKLSWKQDAWKTLNTKIYSLYSSVGSMKLSTAYNLKSTTVSDSTKATVKAGNNTQIRKAVEEINKRAHNSEAVFGIHDATNRVMIKIVDKDTKEVLKEYPPEKTLDMIAKVWEVAGLLVDEKM